MTKQNKAQATGRRPLGPAGFTLVEILIVVIILGILAAIIIPSFSSATVQSRETMIKENLRVFRQQIGVYRAEHNDVSPGYPAGVATATPTEETFIQQMTQTTDEYGNTPGLYGPYMRKIPENSMNNLAGVMVLANDQDLPAAGSNDYGWIFSPQKILFCADNAGVDSAGKAFIEY